MILRIYRLLAQAALIFCIAVVLVLGWEEVAKSSTLLILYGSVDVSLEMFQNVYIEWVMVRLSAILGLFIVGIRIF